MILYRPIWILLALPLVALLVTARFPTRILNILRGVLLVLLLLCLCRPAVRIPGREGTIVVVADRSDSMSAESLARQKEAIGIVRAAMRKDDRLAVVSFGHRAAVEQSPQAGDFPGFVNAVGGDQSKLAEGLDLALTLIPRGRVGRLLVLSDGRWTGRDPISVATRCAARGIGVDYRLEERLNVDDVAVHRFLAPPNAVQGESYLLTAWIHAPARGELACRLYCGEQPIVQHTLQARAGFNRVVFRDTASEPGTRSYTIEVDPSPMDPIPENNRARLLVGVRGARPVLCLSNGQPSGFVDIVRRGGVPVVAQRPGTRRWSLDELAAYSAVLVENVSANDVGVVGMSMLAAWVENTGAGLMMTGGRNAYGPGGYFRSPLEPLLPVSMELRKEHRKFQLAMVIAMDRSGSMAMPAGGGKTKMDLANIGAVQVLDMLSNDDELGVIAVDSMPHSIVELAPVERVRSQRRKILTIDSMGDGIFVYEALTAAAKMLLSSSSATRHIILFADAADAEEPGAYVALIDKCRAAGITVSVVGLGTRRDPDARLLEDIARRGGGRCFFTAAPKEIPRLFAQDTFAVTRSALIEEETRIKLTSGYNLLSDRVAEAPPPIGGYNLCYARPDANIAAITIDEFNAPVVASWYAGSGRVLCYTGEADGDYAGPLAAWDRVGDFFTSLVRWTAGEHTALPGNMLVRQRVESGICRVALHLDPEREAEPFSGTPFVSVLRGRAEAEPVVQRQDMGWQSADMLTAEIPLSGSETVLATVHIPGLQPVRMSPVCLPYSPEFRPPEPGKGAPALEGLARATGGDERIDLAGIWSKLAVQARYVEITHWLVLLAMLVFLLEILQRRTGVLTGRRFRAIEKPKAGTAPRPIRPRRKRRRAASPQKSAPTEEEAPVAAPPEPEPAESTIDAMQRARKRAQRRTRR